jgi:signal transduction histidine kinase
MKNITHTKKLIFCFLFLGIGEIIIVIVFSFYGTKRALTNRTFDELTSLRIIKKQQIELFFSDRIKDVILLSGQSMVTLKLRFESLLYINEPLFKENINILKDQLDGTIDEIRRISNNLMPSVLEVSGIVCALRNLCHETGDIMGIKIERVGHLQRTFHIETAINKGTKIIVKLVLS